MNQPRLSSYRREDLRRLLDPASIAVIGASPNPASLGGRTLANLARFAGAVYPINGRYPEIAGRRCYPGVADAPQVPDCAVIAIPMAGVEVALRDCAAAGVGAAVIFAIDDHGYGYRDGRVEDPYGHQWLISQKLE